MDRDACTRGLMSVFAVLLLSAAVWAFGRQE